MRREHDVFELKKAGVELWLILEYIEARPSERTRLQRFDQRRVVHDAAARRVDENGGRLHFLQFSRTDQVMRLRRIRHLQYDEVGLFEEFFLRHVRSIKPPRQSVGYALAVVINYFHVETRSAARDRLADAAHADDAERRMVHVDAQPLFEPPTRPLAGADITFDFGDAARRRQHERPRK